MRYGKVIMILRFPIQIQKAGEVGFDCNLILLQLVLIGIVIQRPCSLGRDVPGLTLWYHYPGYKQDIIFLGKERRIVVILEPLDIRILQNHLELGVNIYMKACKNINLRGVEENNFTEILISRQRKRMFHELSLSLENKEKGNKLRRSTSLCHRLQNMCQRC